jgi:hypothetical protein
MMDRRVILGGIGGGLVILAFALSILLIVNGFFPTLVASGDNLLVGMIPLLLAPIAGGFLAGLIGRPNPHQSGLIAGLLASLVIFIGWLVIVGLSVQTILSGLVIVFLWVVLARLFAGFAQPRLKS